MKGRNKKDKFKKDPIDFEIDDYDGELLNLDRDEVFYSEEVKEEQQEDEDYTDFNRINEYDSTEDDLYDKSLQESKEVTTNTIRRTKSSKSDSDYYYESDTFYLITKWVKIIGIFLMIVCVAYYLSIGDMKALLIYLILLGVAYFCGYGFMYIMTNSSK